jgi:RNA polymerase sigma-70 factor (ECF subfamily)
MSLTPPTTLSADAALIALLDRLALGDESALKPLYDLTAAKLYGLALRVLGQRERAEDALQEAYLQIWRSAADYRASLSPPMAWLGLTVRSRALDLLRRHSHESHTAALDEALTDTLPSPTPGPPDAHLASEQARALHQCIHRLESRQRELVSLAYLRDLSHSELAEQLRLPLGTVKTWLRRGLDQLRACMTRFA